MKYINFGRTGMRVSELCFGTLAFGNQQEWNIDISKSKPIVKKAIDLGINFFDTANAYSAGRSEEITGELLREYRSDIVLSTKVYEPMGDGPNERGLSRLSIMQQIEKSLNRLKTDYIDIYWAHRWDYNTPIDQTLVAFDDLVHQGKVRYIGASSMYAWQLAKALWTSDKLGLVRYEGIQNHYNLVYREEEREMIPLCRDMGLAINPWSPLGRGFLTGKYKRGEKIDSPRYRSDHWLKDRYFLDEDFDVLDQILEIASDKDVQPSQIALAWVRQKGTIPIVGTSKLEHVESAVESLDINLTDDDMKRLEVPYKPHIILGHH